MIFTETNHFYIQFLFTVFSLYVCYISGKYRFCCSVALATKQICIQVVLWVTRLPTEVFNTTLQIIVILSVNCKGKRSNFQCSLFHNMQNIRLAVDVSRIRLSSSAVTVHTSMKQRITICNKAFTVSVNITSNFDHFETTTADYGFVYAFCFEPTNSLNRFYFCAVHIEENVFTNYIFCVVQVFHRTPWEDTETASITNTKREINSSFFSILILCTLSLFHCLKLILK